MRVDVAIIGGGIGGMSLAGALAGALAGEVAADVAGDLPQAGRRQVTVALLEQEDRLAYHTTGRSAATFLQTYGSAGIRALTRASRPLLDRIGRDRGVPVLTPRPHLWVAGPDQLAAFQALLASNPDLLPLDGDGLRAHCPAMRPDSIPAAAIEHTACDLDVDGIFQYYRRAALAGGASVLTGAGLLGGEPAGDGWRLRTAVGDVACRVVVNAAGAWADEIAKRCAVPPAGLTPLRRTAAIASTTRVPADAPMVGDVANTFYFRPESGGLLISPADETPSPPCDARPDMADVALAMERVNAVTTLDLRAIRTSWAGLRTFTADRNPVVGFDPRRSGFFWLAGQGGYGIQIAAALAQVASAMITDVIESGTATAAHGMVAGMAPDRASAGPILPDARAISPPRDQ